MALNALKLLVVVLLCPAIGLAWAGPTSKEKYLTISNVRVKEISTERMSQQKFNEYTKAFSVAGLNDVTQSVDPIETAGRVIQVSRDLVALGEEVYRLVIKGKPSNVTEYSPISIVPKVNGVAVDILDTENWQTPIKKTYTIEYENLYGITVVSFKYSVLYSYGGSYDGKGAYLTAVQIVPESVRTLFGFDFRATMKLGGIQNLGTKKDPIAGATLLMEYNVSSVMTAQTKVDIFHINGKGGFKNYQR